jgi:hypothetical protein
MRFPYSPPDDVPTSLMPRLPLTIGLRDRTIEVIGLLDTGSAVNILPYQAGLALGAIWEEQTTPVPLVGSLGQFEARVLIVWASLRQVTQDKPVRLAFAWTQSQDVPVIFGQMNFFLEFDVCFYRSQGVFDVRLKDGF